METLTIEWRHYDKGGNTCTRCSATGKTLAEFVTDVRTELSLLSIDVNFIETKLPEERMSESNLILLNGTPLEQILTDANLSENECESCSCLTGTQTTCRTIEHGGMVYEEIPEELIRQAISKILGVDT